MAGPIPRAIFTICGRGKPRPYEEQEGRRYKAHPYKLFFFISETAKSQARAVSAM